MVLIHLSINNIHELTGRPASWDFTLFEAQRLEQYFTFSQSRSHFFRQVKGRSQTGQILEGKLDFFILS